MRVAKVCAWVLGSFATLTLFAWVALSLLGKAFTVKVYDP